MSLHQVVRCLPISADWSLRWMTLVTLISRKVMSRSLFISQIGDGLAAKTQSTRTSIWPAHSRPLESGEFMPVRSKCRKGSEVSLSRVPSQWCGSGRRERRSSVDWRRNQPWCLARRDGIFGCPADHCVWCIYMGRQARRHSCMSLPMLVSILRAVPRVASM